MKKVFFLSLGILLAAGCSSSQTKTQDTPPSVSQPAVLNAPTTATNSTPDSQNAGPPIYNGRPIFVGTLELSDNQAKGNLMLLAKPDNRMPGDITKDTTLYIITQRDYNNLIGKKVLVGFTGDPNNHINSFSLIDIVEDTGQTSFPE